MEMSFLAIKEKALATYEELQKKKKERKEKKLKIQRNASL